MKYIDPKTDLTFKKVFGEHPDLTVSLLNALLPLEDGRCIESVSYIAPELLPATTLTKNSIVDVYCTDNLGRQFIVEMQMFWTSNFKQRVLFNTAKVYVGQLKNGLDFSRLQPVYSLNLVNDIFEKDSDDYYHYYHMVHDRDTDKVLDGFHIVFVELPKFKPQSVAEKKMTALWLRYLTEIDDDTLVAPQELLENVEVSKALNIIEQAGYTREQLMGLDIFWDRVRIEKELAKGAKAAQESYDEGVKEGERIGREEGERIGREEGERIGREEGEKEGERKALIDTARRLKGMGMSAAQIAEATGLSLKEA